MDGDILFGATEDQYNAQKAMTSADVCDTEGVNISPYEGTTYTDNKDRVQQGAQAEFNVDPVSVVGFKVDAAGSGTPITPPQWARYLNWCGFDTNILSDRCTYQLPATKADLRLSDSGTLRYYDPVTEEEHLLTGVRGKVKIMKEKGQKAKIEFYEMTGNFHDVAHALPVTQSTDYSNWQDGLLPTAANLEVFEVDGWSGCLESYTVEIDVSLIRKGECGAQGVTELTKINAINVTAAGEAPNISDKNFWEKLKSHDGTVQKITSALQIGSAAGEVFRLDISDAQLVKIERGGDEDNRIYTFSLRQIDGARVLITTM